MINSATPRLDLVHEATEAGVDFTILLIFSRKSSEPAAGGQAPEVFLKIYLAVADVVRAAHHVAPISATTWN